MKKRFMTVISMHERRKSDESIEITAYLLKHKPIDETDINAVEMQIEFITNELHKRGCAKRNHGAEENYNDKFIRIERNRLKNILKALRRKDDKNTSKKGDTGIMCGGET